MRLARVRRLIGVITLSLSCAWLSEPVRAGSAELTSAASAPAAASGEGPVTRDGAPDANDPLSPDFPLFGVASYFLAQVFSSPSEEAPVYGYLRRGAGLRLKPGSTGAGCDTEWHAVFGGGYVCAGRGVSLEPGPQSLTAPAPPMLYEGLPYHYAKLRAKDAAMYSRQPTAEEELEVTASVAQARRLGLEPTPAAKMPLPPKKPVAPARGAAATKAGAKLAANAKASARTTAKAPDGPVPPLPLSKLKALPDIVRMLLQPGFYVSLDHDAAVSELDFARTVRGDYVRLPSPERVRSSSWHGTVLRERPEGPIALVVQPTATSFRRDAMSGALIAAEPLRPLEAIELGDEVIVRKGRRYHVALDGRIVAETALRRLAYTDRPALVPSRARWIAVSLQHQMLVAYEGEQPVYATLVSTGKAGHETPTGVFRIHSKHVSTTMDGDAFGDEEAYSIEDVPWVMYFSGSYALHGAFWHEKFGRPRSHGCVNLAPLDARWLFEWAGPRLPAGFHGILSANDRPGTFVVVTP